LEDKIEDRTCIFAVDVPSLPRDATFNLKCGASDLGTSTLYISTLLNAIFTKRFALYTVIYINEL
jgi:hypothetical protein